MSDQSRINSGIVILNNTSAFPFNNSMQAVALPEELDHTEYAVMTELVSSSGEAGDILVSDKAINGFKIAFTGSAQKTEIRYLVIGGRKNDSSI